MTELRYKIIGIIVDAGHDELGNVAVYADRVLALPEISSALLEQALATEEPMTRSELAEYERSIGSHTPPSS